MIIVINLGKLIWKFRWRWKWIKRHFLLGLEGDEPLKGSRSTHAAGTSPFSLHKAVIVGEISCSCLWVGVVQPETGRRQRCSSGQVVFFSLSARSFPPSISGIIIVGYRRPGTCSNSVSVIWFFPSSNILIGSNRSNLSRSFCADLPKSALCDDTVEAFCGGFGLRCVGWLWFSA